MAVILKVKDAQGNWNDVPAIKGAKGDDGYSAEASVTKAGDTATVRLSDHTHGVTTVYIKDGKDGANTVSVSPTGTSTDEVKYITINGVEKKLAGGSAGFLAMWDCVTGLPTTTMPSTPYTYKTGDYYRVGAVSDGYYHHMIHITGTDISGNTINANFNLPTDSSSSAAITGAAELGYALYSSGYSSSNKLTATGTVTEGDDTYAIAKVAQENYVITFYDDTDTLISSVSIMCEVTITDTVRGITNYKPQGGTYSGSASTAVETDSVEVGWVYYFDGAQWLAQSAGGGVKDAKVNGTSVVDSNGIAQFTVVDDLTSTSTANSLSANQGRVLNAALGSKADLEGGKVPISQLPSFITAEVIEGYLYNGKFYQDSAHTIEIQGQSGKIYVDKPTGKSYKYIGNKFVEVSEQNTYYSLAPTATTMGELRTAINNINASGMHVLLDLHNYLADGYVCTVHCYSEGNVNYCSILDLLYHRTIFCTTGYADNTLISTYCSTAGNIWVTPRDIQVNGSTIISNEVATIPILSNTNTIGLVNLNDAGYGITKNNSGCLQINRGDWAKFNSASPNNYLPIVCSDFILAAKKFLGNSTISAGTSNTSFNATEKADIRTNLGLSASIGITIIPEE